MRDSLQKNQFLENHQGKKAANYLFLVKNRYFRMHYLEPISVTYPAFLSTVTPSFNVPEN